MKKKKNVIYIIVAFIVSAIGIGFYLSKNANTTEAAWWNESFPYRQTVAIANTSTVQTDYQVLVTLNTAALIGAGKMSASCADLRIVDILGKSLPYWIEPGTCNNASTLVWTKIPSVPAGGTIVYVYYGDGSALSQSSIQATFIRDIANLQGSWKLDETSTPAADSSGNGNNGTWTGNATSADAKFGKGISLDGNGDYVAIADPGTASILDFANGTSITISMWVNPSTLAPQVGGDCVNFINKGPLNSAGNTMSNYGLQECNTDGKLIFMYTYSSGTYDFYTTTSSVLSATTWQHIAFTYTYGTGSSAKMYVNGVLQAGSWATSGNNSPDNNNVALWIGADDYGGGQAVDEEMAGLADEVRLFKQALTSTEIADEAANYGYVTTNYPNHELVRKRVAGATDPISASAPTNEEKSTAPIVFWRLDQGAGTILNSSIGTASAILNSPINLPTWQPEDQCVAGRCLYFEGSNASASANTAVLGIQTISFWAKPASSSGTIPFISLSDGTGTRSISSSNLAVTTTGISSPTVYVNGLPTTTLNANRWNFVTITSASGFNATNPVLGKVHLTYFKGFLDEVKFYNFAQTATQVKSDYNAKGASSSKGSSAILGKPSNDALNNGLVGYWKMDEASGNAMDSSGNGNTAVPTGTTVVAGKFANGRQTTSSSNYLTVTSASSLNFTNQMSTASWIYLTSYPSSGVGRIFGRSDSSYELAIDSSGSGVCGQGKISVYLPSLVSWQCTNYLLNLSTWYHLSSTFDGSYLRIYVDGNLIWTSPRGTINMGGNLLIGTAQGGSEGFPGTIDEGRIYNRALSSMEISQLYNWAPGPVGYYNFNEGATTVTSDTSGNENTGSITGAIWSQGKYGKSLYFNAVSTTNVTTADKNYLDFTYNTPFSIGAWIKTPGSADYKTILAKTMTSTPFAGYLFRLSATNLLEFVLIKTDVGSKYLYVTSTAVSDNLWHYVYATYDGSGVASGVKIYLDGVKQSTTTIYDALESGDLTNTQPLMIGAQNPTPKAPFLGNIDEVIIYNYARSQKQILEDMNGGHPAGGSPVSSMQGHWKFDDNQGYYATSSGVQATTGTLPPSTSVPPVVGISGWQQSGKFGQALAFNGTTNYIDFGDLSYTKAVGTFSASLWVRPNTLATSQCLLCKWNNTAGAASRTFAIETDSSTATAIKLEFSTDGNTGIASAVTGANVLSNNAWAHVVMVYDSSKVTNDKILKLYVNGLPKTLTFTGTIPNQTQSNAVTVRAGSSSDGARFFSGLIDELKLYSTALSNSDVLIDYNRGSSIQLGAFGAASNSAEAIFCPPGDTSPCVPPVGYWKFDEGTGTPKDSSGNGNNTATVTGTGGYVNGKIGKAYKFDSAATSVNAGSGSSLDNMTAFTISAWVKPGSVGEANEGIVVSKESGGDSGGWLFRANSAPNNQWALNINRGTQDLIAISANGTRTNNVWQHVTVVFDGTLTSSVVKFYINGILVPHSSDQNGSGTRDDDAAQSLYIGNEPGSGQTFDGIIDEVKIYDYARTPAQVAWDFNHGDPVGYWKLNECSGTVLNDSSTATNSASLSIGTPGAAQTSPGTCTDGLSTSAWYNGASGKFNASINLDGADDKATVTTGINQIQSISFWAKPASSSGTIPFIALAASPAINITSTNLAVSATGWSSPTIYVNGKAGTTITANAWNHIAVTSATGLSANAITFGYISPTYFKGQIDEIKLFNYALNATQIKLDYNQNAAVRFGPTSGSP